MFIDRVKIHVEGGNGGNGCVSFYRAKYVTNGGPDGGDGGKGGDVVFQADRNINTLVDFRYKKVFKATHGEDGQKSNRFGKSGEDLVIKVPTGTIIREAHSGKIMADLSQDDEKKILIKGGRGGWGNQHYATPTMQAPRYAQKGQTVKQYDLILELKLIADVGLIGFPNAGKSSILNMVTNANPKIANYHFTTLSPNLGVVSVYDKSFVLADIPGLIEGAHEGLGLGHEFLRHIERTKVLVHVVDSASVEGDDPVEAINKINNELSRYNEKLLERPQIIAANKIDLLDNNDSIDNIKNAFPNVKVMPISAATGQGLSELIAEVAAVLENYPENIVFVEDYEEYAEIEIDSEPFTVTKISDTYYRVEGTGVEKMVGFTDLDTEKGFNFFQKYLREKGIISELEAAGVQQGNTIEIYGLQFEFMF